MANNIHSNTPEKRLEEEKRTWNTIAITEKNRLPQTIEEINTWIRSIIEAIGSLISNADQIPLENHQISSTFGVLQAGRLMDASSQNNDCLVHSFLTIVSPLFRKLQRTDRNRVASYFRRFIMVQIPEINQSLLKSYHFLTTAELEKLARMYDVSFIVIKDSDEAAYRSMEVIPSMEDPFWNRHPSGPYHVIHGTNAHFTPVAYDGNSDPYTLTDIQKVDIESLMERITQSSIDDSGPARQRLQEVEHAAQQFIENHRPQLQEYLQQIKDDPSNKAYIVSNGFRTFQDLTSTFMKTYNGALKNQLPSKIITKVYDLLTKEQQPNEQSYVPSNSKQLENEYVIPGLTEEEQMKIALQTSINEQQQSNKKEEQELANALAQIQQQSVTQPSVTQPLVTQPSVTSTTSSNSTVLRVVHATANGSPYTATVYAPIKGGKRRTRKGKKTNRKTKRNIKK